MPIEQQRTVEVLSVEVGDDYSIELTARDLMTGDTAVVSLTWDAAQQHVDEVLAAIAEANEALSDRRATTEAMGFDRVAAVLVDAGRALSAGAICADCREGKHGACIGSAFVENGPDIDEVECRCTQPGHRGRS